MHIHVGHELRVEALNHAINLESMRASVEEREQQRPTIKAAAEVVADAEEFLNFLAGRGGS